MNRSRLLAATICPAVLAILLGESKLLSEDSLLQKPAPEIIGKDIHGMGMRLSDFRGNIVVLDFWARW